MLPYFTMILLLFTKLVQDVLLDSYQIVNDFILFFNNKKKTMPSLKSIASRYKVVLFNTFTAMYVNMCMYFLALFKYI